MRYLSYHTDPHDGRRVYIHAGDVHAVLALADESQRDMCHGYEQVHSPTTFRQWLTDSQDLPLAAIYRVSTHLFLLGTTPGGCIYIKRDGKLRKLLADGQMAKGTPRHGDEYICTTSDFVTLMGGEEGVSYYFNQYTTDEVVELMRTYDDQEGGFGFLILSLTQPPKTDASIDADIGEPDVIIEEQIVTSEQSDEDTIVTQEIEQSSVQAMSPPPVPTPPMRARSARLSQLLSRLTVPLRGDLTARLGALGSVRRRRAFGIGMLVVALIVAAVIGMSRSEVYRDLTLDTAAAYTQAATEVRALLTQGETEAFVDIVSAQEIYVRATQRIDAIPAKVVRDHAADIESLKQELESRRRAALRLRDAQMSEYFDLTVERPDVTVTDVDAGDDIITVLDGTAGIIYRVSTLKRAYTAITSDKLKGATQIAQYDGRIYVLTKQDGIYLMTPDASTRVVVRDPEWGKIVDMRMYSGNIYLLDGRERDIYRYSGVDETTYGERSSYLSADERVEFIAGDTMSIDGSIYIAKGTTISRYESGVRRDFKLSIKLPEPIQNIHAILDSQIMTIYDATAGVIYLVEKSGAYKEQLIDPKLKGGSYATVVGTTLWVVSGSKIYSTTLAITPSPTP